MAQADTGRGQATPLPRGSFTAAASGFEDFVRHQTGKLRGLAFLLGAPPADVDDIVNQTLKDVWVRWAQIRDPHAYATQALRSNLIKAAKESQAHQHNPLPEETDHLGGDDDNLTAFETGQWLEQLLRLLPPMQQAVLARTLRGLRCAEIGQDLGLTPATVRQHLRLARLRMRQAIVQQRTSEVQEQPLARRETP